MTTMPKAQAGAVDDGEYREIIPTAILTAYPRTFSDIPYSQAIFDELVRHYGAIDESLLVEHLAVELEARSKLIDKLLAETGATQVLEVAAGFSPRGLIFSQTPDITYLELDLPDLIRIKQAALSDITKCPPNLHFLGGNALRASDFLAASTYFDQSKEIVVVNEGLLRYLTFDEKAVVAKNIKALLQRFGGVWISGDGGTKRFRDNQDQNLPGVNANLTDRTGRNTMQNAFESAEHYEDFFRKLGFSVEFHSFTEVQSMLSSPKALGLSDAEVSDKMLAHASVKVLRLQ